MACRTLQYRDTIRPQDGVEATLPAAVFSCVRWTLMPSGLGQPRGNPRTSLIPLLAVLRGGFGAVEGDLAVKALALPVVLAVKGHRDFPVGGQLISLRVDRLCPC